MLRDNPIFDSFVARMTALMEDAGDDEARVVGEGQGLLAELVSSDTWLPDEFACAHPDHFKQYMLHRDVEKGFTILCVVWSKGQSAAPHDHTVWGLIGQLRGAERTRVYDRPQVGQPMAPRGDVVLHPGETTALSPRLGDIHDVANVADGVSISIHVYGGDLEALAARRNRYDAATGATMPFIATYH